MNCYRSLRRKIVSLIAGLRKAKVGSRSRRYRPWYRHRRTGGWNLEDGMSESTSELAKSQAAEFSQSTLSVIPDIKIHVGVAKTPSRTPEESSESGVLFDGGAEGMAEEERVETKGWITKFAVGRVLGDGAFGRVYLARLLETIESATHTVKPYANLSHADVSVLSLNTTRLKELRESDDSLFALKVIKKARVMNQNKEMRHLKEEKTICQNFLQTRNENPFLMKFYAAFQTKKTLCFLTEYCHGGDLYHLLGYRIRFPESWCAFYLAEVLLAIRFLHSKNIVYRDLKPENVCIAMDGHIRLIDFGLAKRNVHAEDSLNFSIVGTNEYMAPEVATECGHGQSCDMWSYGVLGYEMFYGYCPVVNADYHDIRFSTVPRNPSDGYVALLKGCFVLEPSERLKPVDAMDQAFFTNHFRSWTDVQNKLLEPPYVPLCDGGMASHCLRENQPVRESCSRFWSGSELHQEDEQQEKFDDVFELVGNFDQVILPTIEDEEASERVRERAFLKHTDHNVMMRLQLIAEDFMNSRESDEEDVGIVF